MKTKCYIIATGIVYDNQVLLDDITNEHDFIPNQIAAFIYESGCTHPHPMAGIELDLIFQRGINTSSIKASVITLTLWVNLHVFYFSL
jgi:hypothetical protein